jgi:hypothetical protein
MLGIPFLCAVLCWAIARYRHCPTLYWTVFGLLMGPFAVLWMLIKTWEPFDCPSCGEAIPDNYLSVGRCPECKAKFKITKGEIKLLKTRAV